MSKSLTELLEVAKTVTMTEPEYHEQRVSFAYGTAYIENENVTRQMVEDAANRSRSEKG